MTSALVELFVGRHGGMTTVHARCKRREPLEAWLDEQYRLWPPDGYGTMAGAIQACPEGFTVNVFRAESCD